MTETEIRSPMRVRANSSIWPIEFDMRPMLRMPGHRACGASAGWLALDMVDTDGGGPRHGNDHIYHGVRTDARIRVDGRAQLRARGCSFAFGAYVAAATLGPHSVDWTGSHGALAQSRCARMSGNARGDDRRGSAGGRLRADSSYGLSTASTSSRS